MTYYVGNYQMQQGDRSPPRVSKGVATQGDKKQMKRSADQTKKNEEQQSEEH